MYNLKFNQGHFRGDIFPFLLYMPLQNKFKILSYYFYIYSLFTPREDYDAKQLFANKEKTVENDVKIPPTENNYKKTNSLKKQKKSTKISGTKWKRKKVFWLGLEHKWVMYVLKFSLLFFFNITINIKFELKSTNIIS